MEREEARDIAIQSLLENSSNKDFFAEIFEKCNLISIKYTDKVGMGQIQEPLLPDN